MGNDMSSTKALDNHLFNLKFASKQLLRDSKRCEKEEKAEKAKLKKAIEKGNTDVARIHAENAVRKRQESLNLLRTSARVDAVASRVQTVTFKFCLYLCVCQGFLGVFRLSGK